MTLHQFHHRKKAANVAPRTKKLNSNSYGLDRAFKCAVDASATDAQLTRDVGDFFPLSKVLNSVKGRLRAYLLEP